jgi:hypothetical protein
MGGDSEKKQKQILEILRVSATFLIQNQIAVRNNLIPFLVLCVFGYVSTYEGTAFSLSQLFGQSSNGSGTSVGVYGIPVTPAAISFTLLVIFLRFGFSLFHGIDLVCSNKKLIFVADFESTENAVLLQSFKDAYLIDSFLIFLNKPSPIDSTNISTKRFVSTIINLCLIGALLFSQSVVLIALTNISILSAYLAAILYFIMFSVYFLKLRDVLKNYPEIAEVSRLPIFTISSLYILQPMLSGLMSLLIIQLLSPHLVSGTFVKFSFAFF